MRIAVRTLSKFTLVCRPQLLVCFLALPLSSTAFAQGTAAQAAAQPGIAGLVATAFSGLLTVHKVQLSGEATYFAGGLKDSGTASLTAADDGSSQMQLVLSDTGRITEAQTGTGSSARCQWSGGDGVSHSVDVANCWRPALWFLPALSLQPSLLSKSTEQTFADLGQTTVGSGTAVYRGLQGQIVPSGASLSKPTVTDRIKRSTVNLGLDPKSYLPAVLAYSVHPNNGAPISIAIEVHYSDYRTVAGAQIPFHIERYVNGSLQLDIIVSSATID